ncbi:MULTISPECIES: LysR family transcriptional regulator [unclassified Corynebacterium]|uniref:LysR family transcriptional regulator n=1 Tax=unclassified Corynebacterium TaxID=2624378 RepID=UPI001C450D29|nr:MULTISPECIES: LysR family transcriptional regulator [unclassified Corynebacterium]MBV7280873.1 LysR family transcriptional regulator [Corynebacterium sp. TAE3-ERU30]MBV7302599.1 LysR family transcriptional regulator [Corynebacterium sp. TAE3-ERU2]
MSLSDLPDLRALQILVDSARLGSFGAAARAHGLSQQAVSERMRRLEGELGVTLFHRGPTGTRLTAAGEKVQATAQEIVGASAALGDALELERHPAAPKVSVYVSRTVSEYYLPRWFAALRHSHPQAQLEMVAVNSDQVATAVAQGHTSLGFIESVNVPVPDSLGGHRVFSTSVVCEDRLCLVVRPDHPWATAVSVRSAELTRTPLILREHGSGTREVLDIAVGVPWAPPVAEASSPMAVINLALSTGAPAVVPAISVAEHCASGALVEVDIADATLRRPIRALWRTGSRPRGAAALMLRAAREVSAREAPPRIRRD